MKRLSFLTALLGIGAAKAQRPFDMSKCKSGDSVVVTPKGYECSSGIPRIAKPANGECPVCGTMAEPYRPEKVTKWRDNCPPPPPPPTSLLLFRCGANWGLR